jgi:hypothetical protein
MNRNWLKGRHSIFQYKFYFDEPPKFSFCFVMGQSKWFIAKKKKKIELGRHTHLVNTKKNISPENNNTLNKHPCSSERVLNPSQQ